MDQEQAKANRAKWHDKLRQLVRTADLSKVVDEVLLAISWNADLSEEQFRAELFDCLGVIVGEATINGRDIVLGILEREAANVADTPAVPNPD